MGAGAGFALKLLQWFNRGIQFACAGLILALNSYFLAAMSNHNITIPTNLRAVEGISGVAVLYTALGILLVCCLAGFTLTSFLAIVLDIAFIGAFIYVATVYKEGTSSCSGTSVNSVFGTGSADDKVTSTSDGGVPLPSYRTACRMESAQLAVAIVAIVFFVISALTEFGLGRHRKKEQRFGPSPANNYTSGYAKAGGIFRGRSLFGRRKNTGISEDPNALPSHPEPGQLRASYNTEATHVDHDAVPAMSESGATSDYKYGETGYGANHHNNAYQQPQTSGVQPQQPGYGNYRYGDGTYNV